MRSEIGICLVVALLLIAPGRSGAGLGDLVGVRVVQDMEIQLLMESPKEMVMPAGAMAGHGVTKMLPASQATHHLEVKAFDVLSKAPIPYMTIKATVSKLDGGPVLTVEVPPMIGSAFHYGDNVALPGKGRYRVELDIRSPQLMRYVTAKERWTAAPKLSFDFDYR
jgi:uncharacterized protein involved in high-affinity Fe2+ transport